MSANAESSPVENKATSPTNSSEQESTVNTGARDAAGGDPHCKSLYVGNLDPRVNDQILGQVFQSVAEVVGVKICRDRNSGPGSLNYGFVDFADHETAEAALQTLNGRKIFSSEIKVNWAFAGSRDSNGQGSSSRHAASNVSGDVFSIFVGDLSPEINDATLAKTFNAFWSMCDARVMWDSSTGKSRGYGFVTFKDKLDAESAINSMNGVQLGSRCLRINWASSKPQQHNSGNSSEGKSESQHGSSSGSNGGVAPKYEIVLLQAAPYNCTVYVGNLPPHATQNEIHPLFSQFGYVTEIRHQPEKGYAFVKFDSHESAARAIVGLYSHVLGGRHIKCNWGKDRPPAHYAHYGGASPMHMGAPGHAATQLAYPALPYGATPAGYGAVPMQYQHAAAVTANPSDANSLTRNPAAGMQPYDANMYYYYMQQQQQQSQHSNSQPQQASQIPMVAVSGQAGVQPPEGQSAQFKGGPVYMPGIAPDESANNFQQYYHQYWENYYQQQAQQQTSSQASSVRNS